MAADEALLCERQEGDLPILRLYGWSTAALSLGRFQPASDVTPPQGATLVRRISGGAAIYHRVDEVTYSVVAPYRLFGGRSPRAAYAAVHGAIRRALAALGLAPAAPGEPSRGPGPLRGMCFEASTDYDILVGGRKLVGSAQRRRGQAFLQHGSLPLSPDPCSPGSTSLAELLDPAPSPREVRAALRAGFLDGTVLSFQDDALRETERRRATRLLEERYTTSAWTFSR